MLYPLLFQSGVRRRQASMDLKPHINVKIQKILLVLTFCICVFIFKNWGRVRSDHRGYACSHMHHDLGAFLKMKVLENLVLVSFFQDIGPEKSLPLKPDLSSKSQCNSGGLDLRNAYANMRNPWKRS